MWFVLFKSQRTDSYAVLFDSEISINSKEDPAAVMLIKICILGEMYLFRFTLFNKEYNTYVFSCWYKRNLFNFKLAVQTEHAVYSLGLYSCSC